METELQRRLDVLAAHITRLEALLAMQSGLIAAVVESLPSRGVVIQAFIDSTEMLSESMEFSPVELAAFEEARRQLLATLDLSYSANRPLN